MQITYLTRDFHAQHIKDLAIKREREKRYFTKEDIQMRNKHVNMTKKERIKEKREKNVITILYFSAVYFSNKLIYSEKKYNQHHSSLKEIKINISMSYNCTLIKMTKKKMAALNVNVKSYLTGMQNGGATLEDILAAAKLL